MKLLDFFKAHEDCDTCEVYPHKRCKILKDFPEESKFAAKKGLLIFKTMTSNLPYCSLRRSPIGDPFYRQLEGDFT